MSPSSNQMRYRPASMGGGMPSQPGVVPAGGPPTGGPPSPNPGMNQANQARTGPPITGGPVHPQPPMSPPWAQGGGQRDPMPQPNNRFPVPTNPGIVPQGQRAPQGGPQNSLMPAPWMQKGPQQPQPQPGQPQPGQFQPQGPTQGVPQGTAIRPMYQGQGAGPAQRMQSQGPQQPGNPQSMRYQMQGQNNRPTM